MTGLRVHKEWPTLFSPEMVLALRADEKRQTRRLSPRWRGAHPGDRLWTRESWAVAKSLDDLAPHTLPHDIDLEYLCDGARRSNQEGFVRGKRRQGLFMPRWASRDTLRVSEVRVQRLHDITEADADEEGVIALEGQVPDLLFYTMAKAIGGTATDSRVWYAVLWEQIHGQGAWAANPEEIVAGVCDWGSMYRGRMAAGMGWLSSLSELLDNSLDAKATKVEFWISPKCFVIEDNGIGSDSLNPFFGFGTHHKQTRGRLDGLGVYGVGGTHAMLWISDEMKTSVTIETRTKTAAKRVRETWDDLAAAFSAGEGVVAASNPPEVGKPTGCRIELFGSLRDPPGRVTLVSHIDNLSFRYSKAIEAGLTIIVHTGTRAKPTVEIVPRWGMPELVDEVADEFDVNGKGVRLKVGIAPIGKDNPRCGLHYRYSYRVIREGSADGCGGYAMNRILGFVDLGEGWRLDRHKDNITDRDAAGLYEAVFQRIEPLLKKAQGQSIVAQSAELCAKVEGMMDAFLGKTEKARRLGKGGKRGTAKPTGGGTKHADAQHKQPGSGMAKEYPRSGIYVTFEDLLGGVIGELKGNGIHLNTRVSAVRRARDAGNADCIFTWTLTIWALAQANDLWACQQRDKVLKTVGLGLSDEAAPVLNGKPLGPRTMAPASESEPATATA